MPFYITVQVSVSTDTLRVIYVRRKRVLEDVTLDAKGALHGASCESLEQTLLKA